MRNFKIPLIGITTRRTDPVAAVNLPPLRSEVFGVARLAEHAHNLAQHDQVAPPSQRGHRLLQRLANNGKALQGAQQRFATVVRAGKPVSPAAEWLLDNFYIVQEQLRQIEQDLTHSYYHELPKLANGEYVGYPRVYALALEIIARTDSRLDAELITRTVQAYQTVAPLTLGELWAVAIMLRLGLIENLRRLVEQSLRTLEKREVANTLAQEFLRAPKQPTDKFIATLSELQKPPARLDPIFVVQLLQHLRDADPAVAPVIHWLEERLREEGTTVDEIVRAEHLRRAASRVSVGNVITSMRTLAVIDWPTFVENVSLVEDILRADPAGVYAQMDFTTRDQYRHAVERIGKRARAHETRALTEQAVARRAVEFAKAWQDTHAEAPHDAREAHVGYYLVGRGVATLEAQVAYRPDLRTRTSRWARAHPTFFYLGLLGLVSLGLLAVLLLYASSAGASPWRLLLVVLLAIIPMLMVAEQIVNWTIAIEIETKPLPKLEFKAAIPQAYRTMVVVPALLSSSAGIEQLVDGLEVRYLANRDPCLHFALLGDFADAPEQHRPEDDALLNAAIQRIEELNARHGEGKAARFYFFHRQRVWNEGEQTWMGWERKRGKLIEFNRLLRGATDTSYTVQVGDLSILPQIKYVITLDADTELPINTAQRLIGTLAHPLNRPVFDPQTKRVVDGYSIIQPRTAVTALAAAQSRFAEIFAGDTGLDPYSTAASDVYQDLFGAGIYVGKAIYDVDAIETALEGRFPQNLLLSHDLLESTFARAGLATDIQLLEDYPSGYDAYITREHRWIRGDWQITDWLFPFVRDERGQRVRNPLPLIERWKIGDNLLRSLMPPTLVLWLIAGWTILPGSPVFWAFAALSPLIFPHVISFASGLSVRVHGETWRAYWTTIRQELLLNFKRSFFLIAFVLHRAIINVDAIGHVFVRRAITHRHLLEWTSHAAAERGQARTLGDYWLRMISSPLLASALWVVLFLAAPNALLPALPLLTLWWFAPFLAYYVSQSRERPVAPLPEEARQHLRLVARKIWRFYATFAEAYDHYLPPDNYQEDPIPIVAHRTSPTNIGFLLLSTVAAYDFGYVGVSELAERLERTLTALHQLERYRGHFYNWYDTTTLHPLHPQYVSTVDSGNLAASLITLKQACLMMRDAPVLSTAILHGLIDTAAALQEALNRQARATPKVARLCQQMEAIVKELGRRDREQLHSLTGWLAWLSELDDVCAQLDKPKRKLDQALGSSAIRDIRYWCDALESHAQVHRTTIERLLPWAHALDEWRAWGERTFADEQAALAALHANVLGAFDRVPSLSDLAAGCTASAELSLFEKECEQSELTPEARAQVGEWLQKAKAFPHRSQQEANQLLRRYDAIAQQAEAFAQAIDFSFLFDPQREIFAIGYNVATHRLDNSFYDLLASECRLTSFVAIAEGQVPARHWFKLGRPLTHAAGRLALLSWGGTMFEYLMPQLLMRNYAHTLLNQTIQAMIRRQIEYGHKLQVPWGVSESGFYAFDYQQNYQYRLFGVPDLGLKREAGDDVVIAPYATFLALPFAPREAWENLQHLVREGGANGYGYYEALDYTPTRRPKNERCGIVRSFMAHHQGMSMVALDNVLHNGLMQQRFHQEPLIEAAELLLQEKLPRHAPIIEPHPEGVIVYRTRESEESAPMARRFTTPHTHTPRTHLLSNGAYTVVLTNAGGGYSAFKNIQLTRWRQDTTRDHWGTFIYVKDVQNNELWSVGYQPTATESDDYEVNFLLDRAVFRRRDGGIETRMEVAVSPEDNVEVRRVTLVNNSRRTRILQLTSYTEVVLDAHNADVAHPAFGKLFVESEFLPERGALLFKRRPRSSEQLPTWALHLLAPEGRVERIECETDRARFLGRGGTPREAAALRQALSNTTGAVLDPIMSLRCTVRIEAGEQLSVSFVTGIADSREHALSLTDEYCDARAIERAFDMVAAHTQVQQWHLGITSEEAHLFQRLASRVLYPEPALRAASDVIASNTQGQSGLWAYGISGDHPIVLLRIDDAGELNLVQQALLAHEFWHLNNFSVDLVILNTNPASYSDNLQDRIQSMINTSLSRPWLDKPGGVFLRRRDHIAPADRVLLETVARVILDGALGALADQLDRSPRLSSSAPMAKHREVRSRSPMVPRSRLLSPLARLQFYNGLGGFDVEAREYVIYLDRGRWTPLPWINVIANPQFGCLVSEAGLGFSWAINSQLNRLTPWSNDPVSDTPSEVIYLRDDETGELWSPTPLPIRADEPYVIRHGAGYTRFAHQRHGIAHDLLVFAPSDDPLKVLRLTLRNDSTQSRTLTLTHYLDWVLGTTRDQNQFYIVSEHDAEYDVLLARNPYNSDFGQRVAFVAASEPTIGVTADRAEFIGRNGSLAAPAALERAHLSGQVGAGLDPCAALQIQIVLEPNQEKEIVFLVGQGQDKQEALRLVEAYRDRAHVQLAFEALQACWRERLETVQVRTPDAALNVMINQWLLYQTLACRMWARSAFYQSGGAYGYRDQLQDVLALVFAAPQLTREQIARAARHQFLEGDVLHWWHPPQGDGVRTRCSDDYLWLPYVTAYYVQTTGDGALLDEETPFLEAPPLEPQQQERYGQPDISKQTASIYEHCARALDHALTRFGEHGLPLMGTGDWNDGMNRVGSGGKGESVWVGWFLYANLVAFAEIAESRDDGERARLYRARATELQRALEEHTWDGAWYRRAYFDDGTPLGAAQNDECQIDSIAQSWAIISGAGSAERAPQAMQSVEQHLIDAQNSIIRLLTPPFDQGHLDPGYIKGYLPGIRENGGQYTHAALWVVLAYVLQGNGDRAAALLRMLNPINRALIAKDVARYKVEPYVVVADVYSHPQHIGRGGWTWYTGSAGWMYRIGVEGMLGLKRRGQALVFAPCIPRDWDKYQLTYRHGATTYVITVENPQRVNRGVVLVEVDGVQQAVREVALGDDRKTHQVRVVLGD